MDDTNGLLPTYDEPSDPIDELPICPLGLPQFPRDCLGYYERGPRYLQLRILLRDNEGVCDILLDETPSRVVVRVIACQCDDRDERLGYRGVAEERTHCVLKAPLGDRVVVDYETREPVPFYVPTWHNGKRTTGPGYYRDRREADAGWRILPDEMAATRRRRRNAPAQCRAPGW